MHLLISCIVAHCTMRSSVQWKSKNYRFVNLLEVSTKFCTISLLLFHCTNVEVSFTAIHKLTCQPIFSAISIGIARDQVLFYAHQPTNSPTSKLLPIPHSYIFGSRSLFFFPPFYSPPPPSFCVSYCSGLFEDSPRDDKIIWEMIFVEQKDYINEKWYSEKKVTNWRQTASFFCGGGGGEEKLISNRKED